MKNPDASLSRPLPTYRPRRAQRIAFMVLALALAFSLLLGQGAALAMRPSEDSLQPAAAARPAASSLSVTKTMVSPAGRTTVYGGEEVVFEIEVENTGDATVAFIPQEDMFDTVCLQFKPKAAPPETSYDNSLGQILWDDLTASNNLDLAPGQSFVTRVTFEVPQTIPGGSHSGFNTATVAGALDASGNPVATSSATVNFTCAERPLLDLDKSFGAPRGTTVLLTGEPISFTISLTNTGPTMLGYIPLVDLFDDSCLTFLPKASPPESDALAGLIEWDDLTASFNTDLAPGDAFTVTLNFEVTGPLAGPVQNSQNVAQSVGALDVFGSPAPDVQDTVLYSCAAPASIGDYVWLDANGNGLQDDGPGAGLNGVTVRLYLDDGDGVFEPGGDDVLVDTQVTSGDGGYLFDMLHAGDYWVDVDESTVPAGLTLTTGVDPMPVTVNYGDAYLDADFGYTGADVSIVKTDGQDPVVAGGVLTYTLTVHNAGPSAALNVIVSDTLPAGLTFVAAAPAQTSGPNPLTWNLGTLAAGANQTIVVTTTVTAPAGASLLNRAEVTTDSSDPDPDNNRDTETTLIVDPDIQIVKTVSLDGQCPGSQSVSVLSGTTVTYCYAVTNTGDTHLSNISVTDDKLGAICTIPLLAPNAAQTCSKTAAITADTINVGTAAGQPSDANGQPLPGIGPVDDDDDAVVTVLKPGMAIQKDLVSPITGITTVSNTVVFEVTVTNTGETILATAPFTDTWNDACLALQTVSLPPASGGACLGGGACTLWWDDIGPLNPGASKVITFTFHARYNPIPTFPPTLPDCTPTTNTALASATDEGGAPVGPVQDDAEVNVVDPRINVEKAANPTIALAGQQVQYSYLVTNPGDVPLAGVTVGDDKCAPVTGPDPAGDVNNNGLLDPGEAWLYVCVAPVTEDTTNTATATGQPSDPQGQPLPGIGLVQAEDTATVDVVAPAIHIEKTADPALVYAGGSVTYSYVVTNPGDVPLAGVTVSDDKCSPVVAVTSGGFNVGDTNGNGLLEPGEAWQYTCTATVSQDTLNTATVVGQPSDPQGQPLPGIGPVRDADMAVVDVIRPGIRIVKTPSAAQVLPGTLVTYTYAVSNTGDAPLAAVVVSDDTCAPVTPVPPAGANVGDVNANGLLDPGETWVFQCSATLDEDTVNVATVTATDPLGEPVTDDDKAFVDVLKPGLQVDKVVDAAVVYSDTEVVYTYTVTNTGTDPAYNVQVTDDRCSPLVYQGGDANGNGLLEPTEVWSYTCKARVVVDTVNIATVTGTDALGNPVAPDEASATVDVINPAIDVAKTAAPVVILPGGLVVYSYVVTNPGDDPLSNVAVSDDKCSPVVYQGGDGNGNTKLDPGETWTYTCTTTLSDDTVNIVTATGYDSLGGPVNDFSFAAVDVVNPAIAIEKNANPVVILPGGLVLYTYVVTNPGDVPLANVSVTDDKCAPVLYQGGDANGDGLLGTSEAWTYVCVAPVTEDTTNTATATGQPSDPQGQPLPGIGLVQAEDTATVDVVAPAIHIEKTADPALVYAGGSVTYSYVVTNPGDVPLAGVTVSDDKCSPVVAVTSGGFNVGDTNGNGLLEPGEAWQYTCTATVSQDTLNTATVVGQPSDPQGQPLPGIGPVRDADMAVVDVIRPGIRIVKTPSAAQVLPGTLVTYTYAVSNTGDAPLAAVVVSDDTCAPVTPVPPAGANVGDVNANGLLDPGETWVFQCSATLDEDTVNVATVTATDPLGEPVTDDDKAFVDVLKPGLQVDKVVDAAVVYSDTEVVYTYTVTNTGTDPAYNVQVTDDRCSPLVYQGGDANGNGLLEPTEVWSYTCKARVVVDTVNIATVTGTDALGNPVAPDEASATVDVINPAIDVAKTAAPVVILPGGLVVYSYVVTNPGDDPLSNVAVSDDKCSPVVYQGGDGNGNTKLDPGETWTYTCTTTLSDDTLNIVTATGDDSLGNPVRDTDTAFVDVVRPAINVEKTANPTVVLPGGVVVYTYAVTNPGDVPLAGVNLTDDKCLPVLYQSGDTNGNGLLEQGEVWIYTCTITIVTDTTNTVTAIGQPADPNGFPLPGIAPVTDHDTAFVDVVNPRINVEKTADPAVIHSGDSVTYTYVVTNPGDVPLAGVTVSDDKCSPVVAVTSGGFNVGDTDTDGLLDPGESWRYTCTTTLTQDTLNTVTVLGRPTDGEGQPLPGIPTVQDDDTAFVDVLNPAIAVVKSGPVIAFVGDTAVYTYTVTNAGDTPLLNVTVNDDICGPATYVSGDADTDGQLDLTETWFFTCSYVVQADDPDPLVNVATAQGQDGLARQVSDRDTWQTDLVIGRIGDTVWVDDDNNGVPDPGEPPLSGVVITLTGTDTYGNPVNLTTTTTITGYYTFEGLLPGTYTVTAPTSSGPYLLTTPGPTGYTVTLTPVAPENLDADFGYRPPTSVQVMDFQAVVDITEVVLTWQAYVPAGFSTPFFHVYRSPAGTTDWEQLTVTSPVEPETLNGDYLEYRFSDTSAVPGSAYAYKLVDSDDPDKAYGPYTVNVPGKTYRVLLPFMSR